MFKIHSHNRTSVVTGKLADMPALLDVANTPEQNRERWQKNIERMTDPFSRIDFGGVKSIDDARALFMTEGWQDGADRARREIPSLKLADLAPESAGMKRRRIFADAGDTVRVEAALAGKWETAYETRARRTVRQPLTLSIGCAFGGNADVNHRMFFWTGLQMAALCDLLEGAGWRVELRALKANDFGRYNVHAQDWTVKQADQPLRLDTALSLFGHAGVYRTFGWAGNGATYHKTPANGGVVQEGDEMRRTFDGLARAGIIPPLSLIVPQAFSREQALTNLRAALKAVREGQAVAA